MLEDINKIVKFLEPLDFKLNKIDYEDDLISIPTLLLKISNKKIDIKIELKNFGSIYELKITEPIEYTYPRGSSIIQDKRFRVLNSESQVDKIIDTGYILIYSENLIKLDVDKIISILKQTFKSELREIKLSEII